MDSFENTKIAAAVLSALLVIFGAKAAIELNSHSHHEEPGYTLAVADSGSDADAGDATAETAAEDKAEDFTAVLAKASAEAGQKEFGKCKGCHVVDKGKPSTVGPNLWGVVNRDIAALDGFKYSKALEEKEGAWSFDNLAAFLKSPKAFAAGTKMVFSGYKDVGSKADLIAYLATLNDTPVALPTAAAEAPATEAETPADAASDEAAKPAEEPAK